MIKFNILTANKLFSDRKFLELQDKRVEQIKIMSNLYQENPNKISDKIETIDNSYKRRQGDAIQKKNKSRDNLSSQMSTGYDDSVSDNKSKSRSKDDKSRYKEERNEQKKEDEFDNTLRKIGSLINSEDENKAKSDDKTNGKKKNLDKSFQKHRIIISGSSDWENFANSLKVIIIMSIYDSGCIFKIIIWHHALGTI